MIFDNSFDCNIKVLGVFVTAVSICNRTMTAIKTLVRTNLVSRKGG